MKHAYLIIAHNEFSILQRLVQQIDDERNDIYIHIDKKVNNFNETYIKESVNKSKIKFIKDSYYVKWGGYSQIEAEMILFNEAYYGGNYRYFHLLSGVDMILKDQNYIHDFFKRNDGYEFISCATREHVKQMNIVNRFNSYINIQYAGIIKRIYMKLYNKLGIKRYNNKFEISYGSNWCSITYNFVKYILDNKNWIRRTFEYSHACDEVYKQCLIINSEFKERLYLARNKQDNIMESDNMISFNLRYIDWNQGRPNPKIFTMSDYDKIISSTCIFARKFSEKIDNDVIEKIRYYVNNKC